MKVWKFLDSDRRLGYGDGRLVKVGETLTVDGEIVLCSRGIHAARGAIDALMYAPGSVAVRGEAGGMIAKGTDKLACGEFIPLAIVDAADTLRHFARLCALDVAHLWSPAPDTVRFLRTGDPALRLNAYRNASSAAAEAESWAAQAAWAAAEDEAWAAQAAWAAEAAAHAIAEMPVRARAEIKGKQRRRLERMLHELIRQENAK